MIYDRIKELSQKHLPTAVQLREEIHMYPETCFEEFETAKKIMRELDKAGISYTSGIGKTGITGCIKGGKPGKTVFLRADIDGLNMDETTDVPYKSKIPGKAHTCGHDGNTASLLGALLVINDLKEDLPGMVKFAFQPAEEGGAGAVPIVESGILENPPVDAAFACHLNVFYPPGQVAVRYGAMMATSTKFEITITGKSGHRTKPESFVDPIVVAGDFIHNLQNMIARKINPFEPTMVNFNTIEGGAQSKDCPNQVKLTGSVRAYSVTAREQTAPIIEDLLKHITEVHGASYEVSYSSVYPPMINDMDMTRFCEEAIGKMIGKDNVKRLPTPLMGGEDFAFVAERVPSNYFLVGVNEGEMQNHHAPNFYFNSNHIIYGIECMAVCAIDYLLQHA